MADSNITKQALAASLRELMRDQPFDKINVAQICERCNMNRKSFYYHFKDKYDLVNWIFDTEFIVLIKSERLNQQRSVSPCDTAPLKALYLVTFETSHKRSLFFCNLALYTYS